MSKLTRVAAGAAALTGDAGAGTATGAFKGYQGKDWCGIGNLQDEDVE